MRTVITWEQLLSYVAVIVGGYYVVILLLYFRKDVQHLLSSKGKKKAPFLTGHMDGLSGDAHATEDTLYHQVHELLEDCKPVFKAAV